MRISKIWSTILSFLLAFAGITALSSPASAITLDMTGKTVTFGSSAAANINDFTAGKYWQVSGTAGADGSIRRYNSVATVNGTVVDVVVTTDYNFTARTITNISASGGVITFTTATAHGFVPNQKVTTTGNSPSAYNLTGVVVASVPSATTFTVSNAASGSFVSGGTAKTATTPIVGSFDANASADFDVDVTAGVPYQGVTFNFTFYEHGTYTGVNTGTTVVLKNSTVNVADLDSGSGSATDEQFAEFSGFQSYLLNKRSSGACSGGDTSIVYNAATNPRCDDAKINVTAVPGTNLTRFTSTDSAQSNNIIQDVAAVKYDSYSSINVKLGNIINSQLGKYIISFSAPTWGTNGAVTYSNANNTPPVINGTVPTLSVASNTPTVIRQSDFGTYYDFDNNPFYQLKITSLPASGTLQYFSGGTWTSVTLNQVITVADIDLGKLRFTGSSSTSFTFKVNDSLDYSTSAYTLNIVPVANSQTISFSNPGTKSPGAGTFASGATATSGLTVSLSSSTTGTCTVSGLNITVVSSGSCTIVASQAGDATYAAAAPVTQTFNISSKTAQTITFVDPGEQVRNGSNVTLSWASPKTSATSNLTVTLSSLTTDVCTVSGTTITLIALGTCSIRATQDGDATYAPASPVDRTFQVVGPSYTLTFAKDSNVGGVVTAGNAPSAVTSSTSWQVAGNTASPALSKTGYSFSGWTANSDGTGTVYAVGDFVTLASNTTLYARWTASDFTVTYLTTNSNSGSAPNATTGSGSISLATNTGSLTRSGYYLQGWVIGGSHILLGGSYNLTSSVSAAPDWAQYTITYLDTNAGSGSAPASTLGAGSTTLASNTGSLTRNNYYFAGWSIGGTVYAAGDSFSLTQDETATPVWGQYAVTYLGTNKSSGTIPSSTSGVGSITLSNGGNLARTNYYLAGWRIGVVDYQLGDAFTLTQDVTASPIWAQYTITYADSAGDGGTLPVSTLGYGSVHLDNNSGGLSLSGGWAFAGWTINGVDYTGGASYTLSGDVTATALYVLGGFSLHYLDTNSDGGSAPTDETGTITVTIANNGTLTRTNYYFVGWSIGGVTYATGDSLTLTSSENATPVWAQYTINYLDTDSSSGAVPGDLLGSGSVTLDATGGTLMRSNFYLAGWRIGGVDYQLGDNYVLNSDATATPIWGQYTITYLDTNAGSGSAPSSNSAVGNITLAGNTGNLVRTGYTFAGWIINGLGYLSGVNYSLSADVTANPRWIQYTITFLSSGTTSGSVPATAYYAGPYTLPSNSGNLVRSGFAFSGWIVDGTNYSVGSPVSITKDTNVFARWLRCGITYVAPTKNSGSVPASLSGCVTIALAKNSGNLQRTGYYFAGWSIDGTIYQPGAAIVLNTAVTATAAWSQYTITYLDADATSGSVPANTLGFDNTSLATNSGNLQRDNYYFAGWVLGNAEYSAGSTYNLRANVFAFAKWKQYKISYVAPDKTGGSISADAISYGYLNLPVATYGSLYKSGHLFSGWMINGVLYQPRDTYSLTSNVTATAQWTKCQISYNDGYSTNGTIPGTTEGCSNVLANPGSLERRNFYFAGWVVEGQLYQPGDTVTLTGHRTAYAQWKRYQISFLSTDATSGAAPVTVYGYGTITTPRNTGSLSRPGYFVSGWLINGTSYSFGSSVNLTSDLVASPIWSQYSVTYSSSSIFVGTLPTRTFGYGITALAGAPTVSRTGFSFGGWVISGSSYSAGSNYNVTGNVTAFVRWVRNP